MASFSDFIALFDIGLVAIFGTNIGGRGGSRTVGAFTTSFGFSPASSTFGLTVSFGSLTGVALAAIDGVLGVDGIPIELAAVSFGIPNPIGLNGTAPGKLSRPGKMGNGGKLAELGVGRKFWGRNGFGGVVIGSAAEVGGFINESNWRGGRIPALNKR